MKQVGNISLSDFGGLLLAISNPWVGLGIVFLLGYFASYMSALSWADLTYVLPASSLGYVLLALIARYALHERISIMRWVGIALVSSGVGFVTTGPEITKKPPRSRGIADHPAPEHS